MNPEKKDLKVDPVWVDDTTRINIFFKMMGKKNISL